MKIKRNENYLIRDVYSFNSSICLVTLMILTSPRDCKSISNKVKVESAFNSPAGLAVKPIIWINKMWMPCKQFKEK